MFTFNRPLLLDPHKHFSVKFQDLSLRKYYIFYFQIPLTKIAILPVEAVHPFILGPGIDIRDIHHLLLPAHQAAF